MKKTRTPTKYTQNTPQDTNKHSVKYQRSPTKWGANIPPGVGADSSRPYPCITKYTYSRHQIRVSVSPHTHIHIINYVFLHHQIHISISPNTHFRLPFRGCIHIRGRDKSGPYGCERIAIMLLTDCQMCPNRLRMRGKYVYVGTINRTPTAADRLQKHCWQIATMPTTNCQNTYNTNTKTLPLCTTLLLPIL